MSYSEVVVNRKETFKRWAEQLRLPLEELEGLEPISWVFKMMPPPRYQAWRICYFFPHNWWENMIVVRSGIFLSAAFYKLTDETRAKILRDLALTLSMAFPLIETTLEPSSDEDETENFLVMLTGVRVGDDVFTAHQFMNWLTTFQRALVVSDLILTEFDS